MVGKGGGGLVKVGKEYGGRRECGGCGVWYSRLLGLRWFLFLCFAEMGGKPMILQAV